MVQKARKAPRVQRPVAENESTPKRPVPTLRTGKAKTLVRKGKARTNAIVRERNAAEQEFRPWPEHAMPAVITLDLAYAITDAHGRYGQPGFSLGEVTARVETFAQVASSVLKMGPRQSVEQAVRNAIKELHDPPRKGDKDWERSLLDHVKKGLLI